MNPKNTRQSRRSAGAPPETPADDILDLDTAGSLLDELRDMDGVDVGVWRAAGSGTPRDRYLFAVPSQGLTLTQLMDKLRDEYGTGEYRVRGRRGSQFVGSSKTVSVEAPAGRELPAASTAAAVVDRQQGGLQGMPSTGEMMMMMMKNSQDLILALLKSPQQQSGLGFGDVLSAAKVMMGQPTTPAASPLAQIREVLELQDMLQRRGGGGGDAEEGGWMDLIKSIAPLASAALAAQGAATVTAPAAIAAPGAAVPMESEAASAAAPSTVPAAGNVAPLIALVGRLIRAAQKDSDPEAYAIFVIDEMGEDAAAQLLAQPDALQRLASILPPDLVQAVAGHAAWFQEFLEAARAQLDEEPEGRGVTSPAESVHGAGNDARTSSAEPTPLAAAKQRAAGRPAARS